MADKARHADLLRQAMFLHEHGKLDEAERCYAAFLDKVPANAQALRLRGVLARERGDLRLSRALLERAEAAAPGESGPPGELALTLMAIGRLEAADAALRRALELDPYSTRLHTNLGALLQHRGRLDEAEACYRRVLEAEPDDLETRCNLANLLVESGDGEAALAEIDTALARAPSHPLVLATLGAVLCGLDRFPEAIPVLERAIAANPSDDMALTNLGYAQARTTGPESAIASLIRAIRANRDNARATSDLVNLFTAIDRGREALELAQRFLERHPGERLVTAASAFAMRDLGDEPGAAAIFDFDRLLHVVDVEPPEGYADIEAFNDALAERIRSESSLREAPRGKSTREGRQTGELNVSEEPLLSAFAALAEREVTTAANAWRSSLPGHPALADETAERNLRCWGTVLSAGGHQVPHMHPLGWISGVYYAEVPRDMTLGDAESGGIEFGAPPERYITRTDPVVKTIEPRPGRMLIFPSYFPHRTRSFTAGGERVSIAFDVMPAHE